MKTDIKYYLFPNASALKFCNQNMNLQQTKNKYTSYIYLCNFILVTEECKIYFLLQFQCYSLFMNNI